MVFLKRDRAAPSAWWLVPAGAVALGVGILLLTVQGGYSESRWEFLCLVGGPLLVVWGIVAGLRGQRIEK